MIKNKLSWRYSTALATALLAFYASFGGQGTAQETAKDRSVAALFRAADADADEEATHLWRAVAEDLAKEPAFRVAEPAAVAALSALATSPAEIARTLGVRFVLLGFVEPGDDILKIKLELVDGATGATVWAGNFFPEEDELDVVPDEIAGIVATHLRTAPL